MPRHPERDLATRRSNRRCLPVVTYLRSKLRGEARQALHQQQFTTIEQFLNRLKKAFGIVGDIFDSDAELKRLGMGTQEKLVSYINRAQTLYSQITEAGKSSGERFTDAEITKLNKRFTRAFYFGLRDDIRSVIERRNDLSPAEMYELAEAADQELRVRHESRIYTRRPLRDRFTDLPARPQRVAWADQGNDYQRSNSYGIHNHATRETRGSNSNEPIRIGNEWNHKQCRYCKNIGHGIEECRKRQYNNSRSDLPGNLWNPSRPTDVPRAGPSRIRPVNVMETQESEPEEENVE